jgi:hypothetical protein
MAQVDSANYHDPLDILRRFMPTPLHTRFRVGITRVMVETNDFTLLPFLPLDTEPVELDAPNLDWKLVRDLDAPGLLEEPLFLSSGKLTIVSMGTACLLGLDHERRELLCFIGGEVDAQTFQEYLVPLFCRLTNEAVGGDLIEYSHGWSEGLADA